MVLKNKSGITYSQDLQVLVVVYGVLGYHNDVSASVWDKIYTVTNGVINFNEKVKMDVVDPVKNQNPVSKRIHEGDRNGLNNSITNRNNYYCNNNIEHNNENIKRKKRRGTNQERQV